MIERLSVAITFYNSSKFIIPAILEPLNDVHVDEIIIIDDGSSAEESDRLVTSVESLVKGNSIVLELPSFETGKKFYLLSFFASLLGIKRFSDDKFREVLITGNPTKIRVIRLAENTGAYAAKHLAVSEARNEHVLLLDGDNFLLESTISNLVLESKSETEILCPNVQIMNSLNMNGWDFWNFRFLGHKSFSFSDLEKYLGDSASEKRLAKFLNTGNFLVPRDPYLKTSIKSQGLAESSGSQDVMLFVLSWLLDGKTLRVVPGFHYFHRLHAQSFWRTDRSVRRSISRLIQDIQTLAR